MKTSNFEVQFLTNLRDHVEELFPNLELTVPHSNWDSAGELPAPDLIIKNQQTGEFIILEIKGGTSANTLPFALVSKLKSMKSSEWLKGKPPSVWLVSSATVPHALSSTLAAEGINIVQSESVKHAIQSIDIALVKLSGREV